MAPVVHYAEVYARELARYGHGRPMWIPEHPDEGGAQLGDVGFIDTSGSSNLNHCLRLID